jgi:cardiolipin synthase
VWIAAALVTALVLWVLLSNLRPETAVNHRVRPLYGSEDAQFERVLGQLLGPPVVPGNQVQALHNGDRIFPAMLEAIRSARRTICLETFIYWQGTIAEEFSQALAERARSGVAVHVLMDWIGSKKVDERLVGQMRSAAVQVERYHPVRWYTLDRINNRTHRKLLVVDGKLGFTGGVGIADEWRGDARNPDQWRDTHFRVRGPVVAQLQAAFMDNWLKVRPQVLHGPEYFPPLGPAGETPAQTFKSSPREGAASARLMYLLAIAAARHEIVMGNSYFVPDDATVEALVAASERGVRVRIVVPGPRIDSSVTRRASRSRWGPLLERGIAIHEFQPTMYHVKIMVVDHRFVSIGSTNFDNRSFRLNDEANVNVFEKAFGREMAEVLEADLARSQEVTLAQWRSRPWREKAKERLAGLLRSQV